MLEIKIEKGFNKDIKRAKKSGQFSGEDFALLRYIIIELENQNTIELKYKRHPLKGNMQGFESIHIKFDWILIFKITDRYLNLVMLGSHTQVYKRF